MQHMQIYKDIHESVLKSEKIVIVSHKSPDGDSIGSSMGLFHFLQKMGKDVVVCHPDPAPDFLKWVEGTEGILVHETNREQVENAVLEADLLICLDLNSPGRVGKEMEPLLRSFQGLKVVIDHHIDPDLGYFDLVLSNTSVASTSELVYEYIVGSGNEEMLDTRIGTPIYLGIMTDTGSFRYPSVRPETHEILANLLRIGVVHYSVHERVFDTNTIDRLKLRGYALSEKLDLIPARPIAYIAMTASELERFNYRKGDTEGLVNQALSVEGIMVAAFFSEKDGVVKISFRSKGEYFVNQLASDHFEGGGHKYAAGGISYEGITSAVDKFRSVIDHYFPQ
jgi:bifunctional oligoribonuclease and PAP phosphatase NrnA